jgi:hypothetical protein
MDDSFPSYLCGIFTMLILAFMAWHTLESGCQQMNDVWDCEWSQNPFTPVAPETQD